MGQSVTDFRDVFGLPDHMLPTRYRYQWWIYQQRDGHYMQVGVSDGKIVTIFAFGEDLSTAPFKITHKRSDVLSHIPIMTTVSLTYKNHTYQFELSEREQFLQPLVRMGDTWVMLYFDRLTQRMEGVRYLNTATLIQLKPYDEMNRHRVF